MLVAIAIPIFTSQLEKSREATDLANVRSAYAEVTAAYLQDNKAHTASVPMKSTLTDLKTTSTEKVAGVDVADILTSADSHKGANPCVVAVDANGAVTINGVAATTSFETTD